MGATSYMKLKWMENPKMHEIFYHYQYFDEIRRTYSTYGNSGLKKEITTE